MKVQIRTIAALGAVALLAAGCSRSGSSSSASGGSTTSQPSTAAVASGDFASLKNVCHPGSATGASDQGITSSQIKVGVLTDVGFTKDPTLINAATVFTDWCNAAGGIDGRKLVPDIHDTGTLNVVQAVTAACGTDFSLVGGSAALDGLAVQQRVSCLLPDFDAQVVMPQNDNSALQIYPITFGHSYSPYAGYYQWLLQKYPDSKSAVGIVWGQSPITQIDSVTAAETLKAEGAAKIYNDVFPVTGASDWTPYAEFIKSHAIKGITFYGTPQELAALEAVLTNMNYKLDWIDANTNAYGPAFIQLAGKSLSFQNNYADLPAVYPLEKASANPASQQIINMYAKYAPGQAGVAGAAAGGGSDSGLLRHSLRPRLTAMAPTMVGVVRSGHLRRASGPGVAPAERGGAGVQGAGASGSGGNVEPPALGVGQAGHEFVAARAVRRHPAFHRRDELSRVLIEEPLPVGGVPLEHLRPLGQLRDGLHAAVPRGRERSPAVVDTQDHQAVDAPADPPHGQAGRDLAVPGRGKQRHPGPAGPAGDHGGRHVEVHQQFSQDVSLHRGPGRPGEAHVRRAAVRPVPPAQVTCPETGRSRPGRASRKSRPGPLPARTRRIPVPQPHHHSTQAA